MKNKKILLFYGDSWTAGHEIDPNLLDNPKIHIMHEDNNEYRESRAYPSMVSNILRTDYINYGFTGYSNDGIVRTLTNTVFNLVSKYAPDEIGVVIGWSSPIRKDLYSVNDNYQGWITLRPDWDNSFRHNDSLDKHTKKDYYLFHKLYSVHFWNDIECNQRFFEHNLLVENLLKNLKIDFLTFDAFSKNDSYTSDHKLKTTFKEYIDSTGTDTDILYYDFNHPSKLSHTLWADNLVQEINNRWVKQ